MLVEWLWRFGAFIDRLCGVRREHWFGPVLPPLDIDAAPLAVDRISGTIDPIPAMFDPNTMPKGARYVGADPLASPSPLPDSD